MTGILCFVLYQLEILQFSWIELGIIKMQLINNLFLALVATGAVRAATNEPCIGSGGDPGIFQTLQCIIRKVLLNSTTGVCVTTSTCSSSGGIAISGACPSDPADVKCCSKRSCGTAANSTCLWQSDCAGTSITNQCPGPSQFKCCQSAADGWGGYSAPSIPSVGACKQVAIDGAKKIVAHFPGRVKTVYCTRDCGCGSGSDHCCGKATDMMCSDNGGVCFSLLCSPHFGSFG